MKTFVSPLPPELFVAKEIATMLDVMNLSGTQRLADLRQWVREGLLTPAGTLGYGHRTAPHVYAAPTIFKAAILMALGDLGIAVNERALLTEVLAKLDEDLGGETLVERVWHGSTSDVGREGWLMRIDVVRPEHAVRQIAVNVYLSDTPNQFRPPIPAGRYSGSLFVDLSHVAEAISAGIAAVLAEADDEGED